MLDAWLDAVVRIVTGPSLCAGVVVEPDGLVATAYHCVANGGRPRVGWRDGTERVGRVVARDPAHDLALIRVEASDLAFLPVRTAAPPVGERVYAMGHPFGFAAAGKLAGVLNWSVSEGIVGAVGDWYVQTDAAMNPGNSGGPLVDGEGAVVGIASRKLRADNVGLCAKGEDLGGLIAAPSPGPTLGGSFGANVGLLAGDDVYVGGDLSVVVRDRALVRGWVGVPTMRETAALGAGSLDVRQAFGRGQSRLLLDAGVGVRAGEETALYAEGRVGWGPAALSVWTPPLACLDPRGCDGEAWWLGVSLGWPGSLGVF